MADGLTKWATRLYSRLPLLGGWLRRGAVRRLAEDDTPEAVRLLAEAVARTDDQAVRILALEALEEVERPRCVEAVCAAWAATRDVYLEELLTIRGWGEKAPPAVRVLWLLTKGREAELAASGAEVVEPLLRVCHDREAKMAARARQALGRLENPEAREALCRAVIDGDDALAREVALAAGYAPRQAERRALYYFLTEQWEAYDSLDFDRTLLRAAYRAASAPLRQRLAAKARQAGRVEWVEVVTGGRQSLRLGEMSDAEWQTTLEVLVERQQWAELWRLAQEAPPRWSALLLQRLTAADGLAPDRGVLEELVRLARAWRETDLASLLRLRATLTAHTEAIASLAVSPDGAWLASGSVDGTIRLWRLADAAPVGCLQGHQGAVTQLGFGLGGKRLLSADSTGRVGLWTVPEGEAVHGLDRAWHMGPVMCMAVSPTGKRAATSGLDGRVWLWPLAQDVPPMPLSGHQATVYALAFSPNGHLLAGGEFPGVRLWSIPSGQLLQSLPESKVVRSLKFSPDGRFLMAGSLVGDVHLWELPHGRLVRVAEFEAAPRWEVSPDLRFVVGRNRDYTLALHELQDAGATTRTLAGHTDEVRCLAFDPRCRVLASGSADRTVELWSLPEGEPLGTLEGHTGRVSCLAISPDGAALVSGDSRGTIQLWGSDLMRLHALPVGKVPTADLAWAEEMLRDESLKGRDRAALEFLVALMRHRRRFDIHLDDGPRQIAVGEFDIEIAG